MKNKFFFAIYLAFPIMYPASITYHSNRFPFETFSMKFTKKHTGSSHISQVNGEAVPYGNQVFWAGVALASQDGPGRETPGSGRTNAC